MNPNTKQRAAIRNLMDSTDQLADSAYNALVDLAKEGKPVGDLADALKSVNAARLDILRQFPRVCVPEAEPEPFTVACAGGCGVHVASKLSECADERFRCAACKAEFESAVPISIEEEVARR